MNRRNWMMTGLLLVAIVLALAGPVSVNRAQAQEPPPRVRFRALEDFIARTGVNREELATMAEIGALNAFGHHRREALWQIERAVRPAGELFAQSGPDVEETSPAERGASLSWPSSQADSGSLQNASEGPKSGWGDEVGPRPSADSTPEMRFAGLRERGRTGACPAGVLRQAYAAFVSSWKISP